MLDVGFQFAVVIAQIDGCAVMNPVLRESGGAVVVVPFYLAALGCGLGTLAYGNDLVVFTIHTACLECGFEGYVACGVAVQGYLDGSGVAGGGGGAGGDACAGDGDGRCTVIIGATEQVPSAGVEQFAQTRFAVDRPCEGATSFHMYLIGNLCAFEATCIFQFGCDGSGSAVTGGHFAGRGIHGGYVGVRRRVGDGSID